MELSEALKVVQALAEGVDPTTGEIFPADSPYNDPHVSRALFQALKALEQLKERKSKLRNLPAGAGKPWSDAEDQQLVKEFESRVPIPEIAAQHQRTRGGIASRLVRLGKIQGRPEVYDRSPRSHIDPHSPSGR